jgi:hypothetical protein
LDMIDRVSGCFQASNINFACLHIVSNRIP